MKLFHTSDWHLGQQFMGKSRDEEHGHFLKWLIQQVEQNKPDALVIAGDIFDTSTPPSYARKRFHDFLEDLTDTGIRCVVIIAGNHDSVAVLNESAKLLRKLHIYVVAHFDCQSLIEGEQESARKLLEKILIPVLPNSKSSADSNVLGYICALPFLRSRDLLSSQAEESVSDKQSRINAAITKSYHQAYEISQKIMQERKHSDLPFAMTGHLTTLGSALTESVRDIYVGNLEGLATDSFPPAHYIALGHIHKPQPASKSRHIHYSGSPIPLSFDEASQQKQLLHVQFRSENDAIQTQISQIPIPCWQRLKHLQGSLAEIEHVLRELKQSLVAEGENAEPEAQLTSTSRTSIWIQVDIEGSQIFDNLQEHLQQLVDDCPIEILRIRRIRQAITNQEALQDVHLQELSTLEVFNVRLSLDAHLDPDTQQRLKTKFTELTHFVEQGNES